MVTTSRTSVRHEAQDELMLGLQHAFHKIESGHFGEYDENVIEEMRKQFRRVEKLFGYTAGSWAYMV
jgi:hypothetical protein